MECSGFFRRDRQNWVVLNLIVRETEIHILGRIRCPLIAQSGHFYLPNTKSALRGQAYVWSALKAELCTSGWGYCFSYIKRSNSDYHFFIFNDCIPNCYKISRAFFMARTGWTSPALCASSVRRWRFSFVSVSLFPRPNDARLRPRLMKNSVRGKGSRAV